MEAWVHRRREVLGTGIEPVPWAEGVRSPGAALRPGAYELKKPGIIRANYTCAHSCRQGAVRATSRGLTPAVCPAWREGGGGASRCGSGRRQGGGPLNGGPRRPELGESPLPQRGAPSHADALQPGTPQEWQCGRARR